MKQIDIWSSLPIIYTIVETETSRVRVCGNGKNAGSESARQIDYGSYITDYGSCIQVNICVECRSRHPDPSYRITDPGSQLITDPPDPEH